MRAFAVSGYSGTGKTSLIVRIVQELSKRGYRIATVKSSKEDILPPPDSDTGKHLTSGAEAVVLVGPESTTITLKKRQEIREISSLVTADFLIIEGMKHSDIPRCWCFGGRPIDAKEIPDHTKVVIVWEKIEESIEGFHLPVLASDDIVSLVDIIERDSLDLSK